MIMKKMSLPGFHLITNYSELEYISFWRIGNIDQHVYQQSRMNDDTCTYLHIDTTKCPYIICLGFHELYTMLNNYSSLQNAQDL